MGVEVRVKVFFEFKTDEQKYRACVFFHLPTDDERTCLHPMLCNPQCRLLGYPLYPWVGDLKDGYRILKDCVYGETIESVMQKLENLLQETKKILTEIYSENKKKSSTVPPPKEVVFYFE